MMADKPHDPDDRLAWPELGDQLRASVEQVRSIPAPAEALDRTLANARRLNDSATKPRPWLLRRAPYLVTGAVAATLLVAVGLRYVPRFRPAPENGLTTRDSGAGPGTGEPIFLSNGGRFHHGPGLAIRHDDPGEAYLPVALGKVGSNWDSWERYRWWRESLGGMSPAGQKGGEAFLRHLAHFNQADPAVWNLNSRPLSQGRIVQPGVDRSADLLGLYVQVRIEGPRARTLIDHIFRNQQDAPLNGTFEIALPDGASPSYFAIFAGDKAPPKDRAAPRESAAWKTGLPTPDELVKRIDPSCWGQPKVGRVVRMPATHGPPPEGGPLAMTSHDPSAAAAAHATFRGAIGRVPPKAFVRVLAAYEETLPLRNGRLVYEYRLPEAKVNDLRVSIQTDASLSDDAQVEPATPRSEVVDGHITYRWDWKPFRPGEQGVVFQAAPSDTAAQIAVGRHGGSRYLFARLRPDVPRVPDPAPFAKHAVFLLDASTGENTARFDRCVKLMKAVLDNDDAVRHFNVLTFSTGAAWVEPAGWIPNTKVGRDRALAALDGVLLEGATDLSGAVERLLAPGFPVAAGTPLHCFLLSDGKLSAGETDLPTLAARLEARTKTPFRWHCYHTGLGEENAELFSLLTRKGGGVYRCPSEKDIPAASQAHRRPCLTIDKVAFEGGPAARDVLVAGRRAALYPGGDLVVAARFSEPGDTTLVLHGRVGERAVTQRIPIAVRGEGELAPRAWGELAVASLLALNDPRLEPLALEYAQQFRVASRVSAFGLTGDPRHWRPAESRLPSNDLGRFVESAWGALGKQVTARQRRDWLRGQVDRWVQIDAICRDLRDLVDHLPERELRPPEVRMTGGVTRISTAAAGYRAARKEDRQAIEPVLAEAARRKSLGQTDDAVRVLTGLLEDHASDAAVLRLVGYRLIATGQAALAVRVLGEQVEQHPRDPATHRALAAALEEAGLPGRAALHHEVTQALLGNHGGWLAGAREEYVFLLRRSLRDPKLDEALRGRFRARLADLHRRDAEPVQVSVTWNSVASGVTLRVTGPDGKTSTAPEPSRGMIGMRAGPRRFEGEKPTEGDYAIEVELTRATPETQPETFVTVQTVRDAGTDRERVTTRRLLLRRQGERVKLAP